jgi:hypothetical protein
MMGKHAESVDQTKVAATSLGLTAVSRQALASKNMPQRLKEVLDNAVKIVIS